MTRKFIAVDEEGAPTAAVPGVPARDLSEEEWREFVQAGLIVEGDPGAELWERAEERGARSRAVDSGAAGASVPTRRDREDGE